MKKNIAIAVLSSILLILLFLNRSESPSRSIPTINSSTGSSPEWSSPAQSPQPIIYVNTNEADDEWRRTSLRAYYLNQMREQYLRGQEMWIQRELEMTRIQNERAAGYLRTTVIY